MAIWNIPMFITHSRKYTKIKLKAQGYKINAIIMNMTRNTKFFLNLEKSCTHNISNKYFEDQTTLTDQKEKNKNSFSIKIIFFMK